MSKNLKRYRIRPIARYYSNGSCDVDEIPFEMARKLNCSPQAYCEKRRLEIKMYIAKVQKEAKERRKKQAKLKNKK